VFLLYKLSVKEEQIKKSILPAERWQIGSPLFGWTILDSDKISPDSFSCIKIKYIFFS
jgi:hypothetical protein